MQMDSSRNPEFQDTLRLLATLWRARHWLAVGVIVGLASGILLCKRVKPTVFVTTIPLDLDGGEEASEAAIGVFKAASFRLVDQVETVAPLLLAKINASGLSKADFQQRQSAKSGPSLNPLSLTKADGGRSLILEMRLPFSTRDPKIVEEALALVNSGIKSQITASSGSSSDPNKQPETRYLSLVALRELDRLNVRSKLAEGVGLARRGLKPTPLAGLSLEDWAAVTLAELRSSKTLEDTQLNQMAISWASLIAEASAVDVRYEKSVKAIEKTFRDAAAASSKAQIAQSDGFSLRIADDFLLKSVSEGKVERVQSRFVFFGALGTFLGASLAFTAFLIVRLIHLGRQATRS